MKIYIVYIHFRRELNYRHSQEFSNFQKINFNSIRKSRERNCFVLKIFLAGGDHPFRILVWCPIETPRENFQAFELYSKRLFFGIPSLEHGVALSGRYRYQRWQGWPPCPNKLEQDIQSCPCCRPCRVVYCLTCTRPDCTIRGTLMHDKLAIYLPVHGFTCTRAPRNHLAATMELSYLDRSRGWLAWIDPTFSRPFAAWIVQKYAGKNFNSKYIVYNRSMNV